MNIENKSGDSHPDKCTAEIIIQGVLVRLVFASEQNVEIPVRVRDILKSGYLQRQTA